MYHYSIHVVGDMERVKQFAFRGQHDECHRDYATCLPMAQEYPLFSAYCSQPFEFRVRSTPGLREHEQKRKGEIPLVCARMSKRERERRGTRLSSRFSSRWNSFTSRERDIRGGREKAKKKKKRGEKAREGEREERRGAKS